MLTLLGLACGARQQDLAPAPTLPLPTAALAGQQVSLLPLTLLAADDSLHWAALLGERRTALDRCDSILGALLTARSPEVGWILPAAVRRAARHAPGVATDPDQLSTPLLRATNLTTVPDPLRSQLRTLAAIAGSGGGRFVLVPAALIYRPATSSAGAPAGTTTAAAGEAQLSVVLVDVRTGQIGWRSVARGAGDDPWTALTRAVKGLTPGLP